MKTVKDVKITDVSYDERQSNGNDHEKPQANMGKNRGGDWYDGAIKTFVGRRSNTGQDKADKQSDPIVSHPHSYWIMHIIP